MGIAIIIVILLQRYYFSKRYNFNTAFTNNEFGCDFGCTSKRDNKSRRTYLFILIILFRDAMLLRQTFSYLTDQHIDNYPFSNISKNNGFGWKRESIIGLYTINSIWIIAPFTTFIWAYINFKIGLNKHTLLLKESNKLNDGIPDMLEIARVNHTKDNNINNNSNNNGSHNGSNESRDDIGINSPHGGNRHLSVGNQSFNDSSLDNSHYNETASVDNDIIMNNSMNDASGDDSDKE